MKRILILSLLSLSMGCASVDRMKRESAQEDAVLRAWEKAARDQAGDD